LVELGHEFLLGDPSAIHASNPRRQKTDKRDARHLLTLLVEDRFPVVWQPPRENEELRQLLLHRCRVVRLRTKVKNQLDAVHPTDEDLSAWTPAVAKNEGLVSARGWNEKRRQI
jgi:transposase